MLLLLAANYWIKNSPLRVRPALVRRRQPNGGLSQGDRRQSQGAELSPDIEVRPPARELACPSGASSEASVCHGSILRRSLVVVPDIRGDAPDIVRTLAPDQCVLSRNLLVLDSDDVAACFNSKITTGSDVYGLLRNV